MNKRIIADLAATISDYRTGEVSSIDEDHVGRWIAQFEPDDRDVVLSELLHVWRNIYANKNIVKQFLSAQIKNDNITKGDHYDFWSSARFLRIQKNGNSQHDMLGLFNFELKSKLKLSIDYNYTGNVFVYLDDVLFTGSRIQNDIKRWVYEDAPNECEVIIILIATHSFGEYATKKTLAEFSKKIGKNLTFRIFRLWEFENRVSQKDHSDVLWPTNLPTEASQYDQGKFPLSFRREGGRSELFSSENSRNHLEQALLKAGLKIRSFSKNPNAILRPLGFGPFGVGFGSLFLSFRNCPNNAPLALWWGDPTMPSSHPFSRWRPLVPRKTYGGDGSDF